MSHFILAYIMVLIEKGLDSIVFTQSVEFPSSYAITPFYVYLDASPLIVVVVILRISVV